MCDHCNPEQTREGFIAKCLADAQTMIGGDWPEDLKNDHPMQLAMIELLGGGLGSEEIQMQQLRLAIMQVARVVAAIRQEPPFIVLGELAGMDMQAEMERAEREQQEIQKHAAEAAQNN